jgi:hypothetical protein
LRETHPDTGGDAKSFLAVQQAWERVGTPDARSRYDGGGISGRRDDPTKAWSAEPARPRKDSRPLARSYGHPGGWRREQYLTLIREWAGRGTVIADPYDPALVRSAPREIRHVLADALAEESTARTVSQLGIAFTVWHDVATIAGAPEHKIDHVVLGPTGLFAILSEDWGGDIRVRKGELIGETLATDERPMHSLAVRAKALARAARVKFTALLIVVPEGAIVEPVTSIGTVRGAQCLVVHGSRLAEVLRNGVPNGPVSGGIDLFELRTRLQSAVRFV